MATTAQEAPTATLATLFQPAQWVERYLEEYLDERPLPGNLREAVRYALLGSGKRLRPILTVHCCEAVGGAAPDALAPAAAIEMIHCFSLVHDDLPALDNDDLRRGRPTLHRHTNEAMAILAGDLMLGLAFELTTARVRPAALGISINHELATATNDMIGGQVYDTLPDFGADVPPMERLRTIHRHKTGALIRCACRMGALCGGARDAQLVAITAFADAIGLMFQIVDDLLDVTQTTEHLGKASQKDAGQGKLTYPGLLGIERSQEEVARLRLAAHQALEPMGEKAEALHQLCDYLAVRQK